MPILETSICKILHLTKQLILLTESETKVEIGTVKLGSRLNQDIVNVSMASQSNGKAVILLQSYFRHELTCLGKKHKSWCLLLNARCATPNSLSESDASLWARWQSMILWRCHISQRECLPYLTCLWCSVSCGNYKSFICEHACNELGEGASEAEPLPKNVTCPTTGDPEGFCRKGRSVFDVY